MTEKQGEASADDARDEALRFARDMRDKGAEAAESARETARIFTKRAFAQGEAYRDAAAESAGRFATALRRASDELGDGSTPERMIGQMAEGIADATDNLRDKSIEDIARGANDFARRNPVAFIGGAALLGFAAARLFRGLTDDAPGGDDGEGEV